MAKELGIRAYEVWSKPQYVSAFQRRRRKCLFVGLSDGSRIDMLRRSNSKLLSQEQIVPMLNIDYAKWRSLRKDLTEELDEHAMFEDVYLIDDFTASGTTFARFNSSGEPAGKLKKFSDLLASARETLKEDFPVANNYCLHVHHHLSTEQARITLDDRVPKILGQIMSQSANEPIITEGLKLGNTLPLLNIPPSDIEQSLREWGYLDLGTATRSTDDRKLVELCEKSYDSELFERLERHCKEAAMSTICYGYGHCSLPLVLEHNTPNNSLPLLWAETGDQREPVMRPLFYRRDRHG